MTLSLEEATWMMGTLDSPVTYLYGLCSACCTRETSPTGLCAQRVFTCWLRFRLCRLTRSADHFPRTFSDEVASFYNRLFTHSHTTPCHDWRARLHITQYSFTLVNHKGVNCNPYATKARIKKKEKKKEYKRNGRLLLW